MKMTRRGFLGASAAVAAGLSAAPARAWLMAPLQPAWVTSAPPVPGLGYLTTLAIAPSDPSILLAGGDDHGLKRTTDGGLLWGQIDQGLWQAGRYGISAIAPHPTQVGTYYALSGSDFSKGAVYRTTDSGNTWMLRSTGIVTEPQTGDLSGNPILRLYGHLLALEPRTSGDILYAASYKDGLFKSTDGGFTWTNLGFGGAGALNLTAVVLHPGDPSTVYLGWRDNNPIDWSDPKGGIKISHDAGQTWSDFLSNVPVRDLVIDPNQTGSVYVALLVGGVRFTHDGGKSWSQPTSGLPQQTPAGPTYCNTIAVNPDPKRTGEVLVGTGEGNLPSTHGTVYRSQDGGVTWTNLVTGSNVFPDSSVATPSYYDIGGHGYAASAVIVPVGQPDTIWVAGRSLVWFSKDSGKSWHPSSAGLEGAGHHHDAAVDPTTGAITMSTGDWAIVQSDPTRQTWTISSLPYPNDAGNNRALCFAFTSKRLLLGSGPKNSSLGSFGGVYLWDRTTKSWNLITLNNLPPGRVVGLATAPSNPDVVYAAVSKNGIYRSLDGGASFTAMSLHGFDPGVAPTSLFPDFFTKLPIAVHPDDPNSVYVLDHVNGLYAYSPTTATWTKVSGAVPTTGNAVIPRQPYQGFAMDATQPSRLYVATPAGLWRSVDAGSSWSKVGIQNTEGFGPLVVDPGTGTVFACTALPGESSALTDRPGIYVGASHGTSWSGGYVDGRFAENFEVLSSDPTAADTVWAASAGSLFSLGPAPSP